MGRDYPVEHVLNTLCGVASPEGFALRAGQSNSAVANSQPCPGKCYRTYTSDGRDCGVDGFIDELMDES
jgi:hypothetical protein